MLRMTIKNPIRPSASTSVKDLLTNLPSSQLKEDFTFSQLTNTLQPDSQSLNPTEEQKIKLISPDQTIRVSNILTNFNHKYSQL